MDYGRRVLFIAQVVFLTAFLPSAFLIGKGVLDLAQRRVAEISAIDIGMAK